MNSNIICRKCGGNHFTTKCGRETIDTKQSISNKDNTFDRRNKDNNTSDRRNKDNNNKDYKYNTSDKRNNNNFEQIYRLQISNLPLDITNEEMKELLSGWGTILKIKVINYEETSVAYIDFKYKDQSEYFINALDKTHFDKMTMYINSVKSY